MVAGAYVIRMSVQVGKLINHSCEPFSSGSSGTSSTGSMGLG